MPSELASGTQVSLPHHTASPSAEGETDAQGLRDEGAAGCLIQAPGGKQNSVRKARKGVISLLGITCRWIPTETAFHNQESPGVRGCAPSLLWNTVVFGHQGRDDRTQVRCYLAEQQTTGSDGKPTGVEVGFCHLLTTWLSVSLM